MRPILFSIGPISISSFGFFAALAFLVACFLIWKNASEELLFSKTPIKEEVLFDGIFVFVLVSLFAARLLFVFTHFERFGFNFLRWVLVREASGFSFLGGFLVGTLALFFFCQKRKLRFWRIVDLFSLGASAGFSLAFIGALLDGVGVGAKTDLPWGVLFVGFEERRHPVQLLAAGFFLFCFFVLNKVRLFALRERLKEGVVFLCFLSLSTLGLFLLDFLKEGEIYFKWLTKAQGLYLGTALVSGVAFYQRLGRNFQTDIFAFFQYLKSLRKKKGAGEKS